VSPTGPVVIDWRNSDIGAAGVDVALTGLIIAQVAVSPTAPAAAARELLDAFLNEVGPLNASDVHEGVAYRSADPNMTSDELELLSTATELLLH
jgi:hypothetical protein